ncbi:PREDICTED: uncharacterized protein LOC109186275 [Ipomoea nil]|uniref:uncharacterized protein LOC109186275 n=1 Tax=Ipomoea nil TaxID=35883 RepID=UPI000900CFF4|nr:PREDICTED: uncharacterized protein LOC109186275 [Ipomoea nil]
MSKESREEVRRARGKLGDIIGKIWLRNFSFAEKPVCCTKHSGRRRVNNGWGPIDSEDEDSSMECNCRRWKELGGEEFVYKHISLANLPIVQWKPEVEEDRRKRYLFFDKCIDAGNLEALYRKGLVDYLGGKGAEDDAIGCLKKAASAGHIASQYAVCIILIFLGGESKETGIRMLSEIMSKESREEVRTARGKLGDIIGTIWLRNFSFAEKPVCCTKHSGRRRVNNGWGPIDSDDEDSSMECKFCKCDKEISHIFKSRNLGWNKIRS